MCWQGPAGLLQALASTSAVLMPTQVAAACSQHVPSLELLEPTTMPPQKPLLLSSRTAFSLRNSKSRFRCCRCGLQLHISSSAHPQHRAGSQRLQLLRMLMVLMLQLQQLCWLP
jgi:hypothetical protein